MKGVGFKTDLLFCHHEGCDNHVVVDGTNHTKRDLPRAAFCGTSQSHPIGSMTDNTFLMHLYKSKCISKRHSQSRNPSIFLASEMKIFFLKSSNAIVSRRSLLRHTTCIY